jgi:hypothetical protein
MEYFKLHYGPSPKMKSSLGIIPFFAGESVGKHSSSSTTLVYFMKTYRSLEKYLEQIKIFVQNEPDYKLIKAINSEADVTLIDCKPVWLPIDCLIKLQGEKDLPNFIYYTEADQVLYIRDVQRLTEYANSSNYIPPYRLDRLMKPLRKFSKQELENLHTTGKGKIVEFNDWPYVIRFYEDNKKQDKIVHHVERRNDAFSGAWFATREAFIKIAFRRMNYLPIEQACLSVFSSLDNLRFNNIFDFFIEHLSGQEKYFRWKNKDIKNYPGAW